MTERAMTMPDRRRHVFREDLAADTLRDVVEAPRYVSGEPKQVSAPSLPVRRAPKIRAPLDTEVLHGERVIVYDVAEGWAWVQLDHDGYVGYVPTGALDPVGPAASHRVKALRTYVFPRPDAKAPPRAMLSLNARVCVAEEGDRYMQLADGGFIYASHLTELGSYASDFVAVAEGFIGTPYLWGGRTSIGLDCSGLVQLAGAASGYDLPRDADMQEAEAGMAVPWTEGAPLRRGDLIFWEGHVGIMTSPNDFLHANAYHMAVVHEPFEAARRRIKAAGFAVTSVRRLPLQP